MKQGYWLLCPLGIPLVAPIANRVLAHLPGLCRMDLVHFLVARPEPVPRVARPLTTSVIVPCRNELKNIEETVARVPSMGPRIEIVFVDGDSTNGTREAAEQVIEKYRGVREIRLNRQIPATGKGDSVRRGFEAARGDVVMILDADLNVLPEDLPIFYLAPAEGRGEFVNGSRLVYPMEGQAMRFLNLPVYRELLGGTAARHIPEPSRVGKACL